MSFEEYDNEEFEEDATPPTIVDRIITGTRTIVIGSIVFSGTVLMPMAGPATAGANTRNFLGEDGKPILMELRNCRIVEQKAPVADNFRQASAIFR